MADDTPRDKKSIGCATSKGMETGGSYGTEKQELQSYGTADVERERAHRSDQGNSDLEMVPCLCTHEGYQESTHMCWSRNGSARLRGSSTTGAELVALLTNPKLAKNSD